MEHLPNSIRKLFFQIGSTQKYDKNKSIFIEGEAADLVFFILDGRVALSKETASGRELTLRISSSNDCIGENIIFTPLTSYPNSAKTLDSTTVLSISKKSLEVHIQQEPLTFVDCMTWLQIQTLKEQTRLRDLLLLGKKGALYSSLIRIANTYGVKQQNKDIIVSQKYTNTDLANLCGTSREVINRFLGDLKKQNIISENQGFLTIHDLAFLKIFCECDGCPDIICKIN